MKICKPFQPDPRWPTGAKISLDLRDGFLCRLFLICIRAALTGERTLELELFGEHK